MKWILSLVLVIPLWAIPDAKEARKTFLEGSGKAREALTQELWTAGEEALPLVNIFLQSDDPEIRSRAIFLKKRILLGLRPDSPKELIALAEAALKEQGTNQKKTIENLLDMENGFEVALRLLDHWSQDKVFDHKTLWDLASIVIFREWIDSRRFEIPLSLECRGLLVALLAGEDLQEHRIAVKIALPNPLAVLQKAEIFQPKLPDNLLLDLARGSLLHNNEEDAKKILERRIESDRKRINLLLKGEFTALIETGKESKIIETVLQDYAAQSPADIEALRASGYDEPKTFAKALCALGHTTEAIELLHDTGNHRRVLAIILAEGKAKEALTYLKKLDISEGSDDVLEARLFLAHTLINQGNRVAAQNAFAPLLNEAPKRVGHRQRTVALAYRIHDLETALQLSRFIRPGFSTHEMIGDMGSLFPQRGIAMAFWTKYFWEKEPELSPSAAVEKALTFFKSPDAFSKATATLSKNNTLEAKTLQEMAISLHRPEMIPALEKKARHEDDGHLLLPAITDKSLVTPARIRACEIALIISPTSPLLHTYHELLTHKKATLSHTLALDDAQAWIHIGKAHGQEERTTEGYLAFEKALAHSPSHSAFELLKRLSLKHIRHRENETALRLLHAALITGITDEQVSCTDLLPLVSALRTL